MLSSDDPLFLLRGVWTAETWLTLEAASLAEQAQAVPAAALIPISADIPVGPASRVGAIT